MRGILSLIGITVVVAAFGLILWSFSSSPLEELRNEERLHAYMEIRQTAGKQAGGQITPASFVSTQFASFDNFEASCGRP